MIMWPLARFSILTVFSVDLQIFYEHPPHDQSGLWANRPFRQYTVVLPPSTLNLDPSRTEDAKTRFLNNLWDAQARYRTRNGQSVALCAEDREVEVQPGRLVVARTYFNLYQRTAFLQESRKVSNA
jgi:protein ECT2